MKFEEQCSFGGKFKDLTKESDKAKKGAISFLGYLLKLNLASIYSSHTPVVNIMEVETYYYYYQ